MQDDFFFGVKDVCVDIRGREGKGKLGKGATHSVQSEDNLQDPSE